MDYRDFERSGQGVTGNLGHWWRATEDKAHAALFAQMESLVRSQQYRAANHLKYARLYGNKEVLGFSPVDYARTGVSASGNPTTPLNIIEQCVDGVLAKNAKNRPAPFFVTSGGSWKLRQKAKKLTKLARGLFYEMDIYAVGERAQLDAEIFGVGPTKFFVNEKGRVACERVLPAELLVDDAEAIYGKPPTLFQTKSVSREELLSAYGDDAAKRKIIEDAATVKSNGETSSMADMVTVVESWHLASGPTCDEDGKEKPHAGKHVICVSSGVLLLEKWSKDYFPFSFLRYGNQLLGFWGKSLVESLEGIQLSINKLSKRIAEILHLCSVPKWFYPAGTKTPKSYFNNDIGTIVPYQGSTPPHIYSVNAVPPELLQREDRLYALAFERARLSQMAVTGKKEPGLDAAVALRERNDIESENFMPWAKRIEAYYMESARICIDLMRDLCDGEDAEARSYKVKLPNKRLVESIDWKQVALDEEDYVLQVLPVSSLPQQPAARAQTVAEWIAEGWVSREQGMQLLDFPDLERYVNLEVAQLEDVDRSIDLALEDGKYQTPEPFQNLRLLQEKALSAYLRAKAEGYPERRLELLRRMIQQARELEASATPPPTPGAMSATAAPLNETAPGAPDAGALVATPGLPPGMPAIPMQ